MCNRQNKKSTKRCIKTKNIYLFQNSVQTKFKIKCILCRSLLAKLKCSDKFRWDWKVFFFSLRQNRWDWKVFFSLSDKKEIKELNLISCQSKNHSCEWECVYKYVCGCVCLRVCACVFIYMCVWECVWVCVCVCVWHREWEGGKCIIHQPRAETHIQTVNIVKARGPTCWGKTSKNIYQSL